MSPERPLEVADPERRTRAISAIGLEKSYGRGDRRVKVLDGIDLTVERGTVFSLLGPNGAGKTTAVRILATLADADGGTARVAGYDVRTQRRQVRRAVSLTGQFASVDEKQTGEENLRMMARLGGLSRPAARRRAAELLERFDLTAAGRRLTGTYSGGMRRRLDLAAGLVGEPEVIFLDEPTTGLDPRSRQELWRVVRDLSAGGSTVFLTTQYLEEADQLADRIAVLDGGRLVAEGTAAELKSRVSGHRLDVVVADAAAYERLAPLAVQRSADTLTLGLPTDGTATRVRALLDEIDPERRDVVSFTVHSASLDDVFMALTGRAKTTKEPTHV
ncbi:daunorubicin resistance protein DrrA family ABC transporter ATP-binding protein [Streptomyces camponoticapitis]|uniref:Daunorubicin resistance protein DrrA family ABC transporter ATP-binding protein n=1 Tax=Streptomyces camponoticapitis TaxID=1616125 RepID=A0ABQ2ESQ2_9ACTN|nr:ATP-binding cassette domain-containing protein [Streptomyces camponoticapitis]GGK18771.1 daunorubicin resistance protein DrrA family ABC transporter ATP-binding protein [Streptomyces camponoticapitis]